MAALAATRSGGRRAIAVRPRTGGRRRRCRCGARCRCGVWRSRSWRRPGGWCTPGGWCRIRPTRSPTRHVGQRRPCRPRRTSVRALRGSGLARGQEPPDGRHLRDPLDRHRLGAQARREPSRPRRAPLPRHHRGAREGAGRERPGHGHGRPRGPGRRAAPLHRLLRERGGEDGGAPRPHPLRPGRSDHLERRAGGPGSRAVGRGSRTQPERRAGGEGAPHHRGEPPAPCCETPDGTLGMARAEARVPPHALGHGAAQPRSNGRARHCVRGRCAGVGRAHRSPRLRSLS